MKSVIVGRRLLQRVLLRTGLWVTPLDAFRRAVASLYYRNGGFSFVQVGANDGVSFDDFYWLVKKFNGRGLVIEPMSDAFDRLVHNYRPFPLVKPIRAAVHPTATSLRLHRIRADCLTNATSWAFGSASASPDWLPSQGVSQDKLETEDVPARHLMDILSENGITDLDVLQIDVEGFDHDVIRMLDTGRVAPRMIRYEAVQPHVADRDRLEAMMANHLASLGYHSVRCGMDVVCRRR